MHHTVVLMLRFLRKILKVSALWAGFLLLFVVTQKILSSFAASWIRYPHFVAAALSGFFLIWGWDRVSKFTDRLIKKILPSHREAHHHVLKTACRGLYRVESLKHLMGLVAHFMTGKVGAGHVAVMVRRGREAGFWLGIQRGYKKNFVNYFMDEKHPLLHGIQSEKGILSRKQVFQKQSSRWGLNEALMEPVRRFFLDFNAELVIPSFLGEEIRTLLILGPKKNKHGYTQDDIRLLEDLAREAAPAVESSRLFDETLHKKNELRMVNEQLEYSKGKLLKALSETEQANKRLQDTQAQLIHEQKMATLGRLAASVGHEVNNPLTILSMNVSRMILKYRKDPELKVQDVVDIFHKMEQNIARIKAVVNTLTGLLKKSEKGKFEPLSLKLVLEETLPLVQFQTYLDNLSGTEVEFDIPGHLPLVKGDLERLQEVFLNLFINAYHAMTGKRNRRIRVSAQPHPDDADSVVIYFSDNGSGMTEEIQKKIFNYGYTTKPPGKGSGLGLYMCKYIIELHGGTISVKSSPGAGSTFMITMPVHVEKNHRSRILPTALSA